MPTRLHTLTAVALQLGFGVCAPAWSASAIYQKTADSESIELSNLDGDDATQNQLSSAGETKVGDHFEGNPGEGIASVDAIGPQGRPKQGTLSLSNESSTNTESIPDQQKYHNLIVQQAATKDSANSNPYASRKYLKIDRASYLSGVSN
jgi:hypothetical protein